MRRLRFGSGCGLAAAIILGVVLSVVVVRWLWPHQTWQIALKLIASFAVWYTWWSPRYTEDNGTRHTSNGGGQSAMAMVLAILLIWGDYLVQLQEREAARPHITLIRGDQNSKSQLDGQPRIRYRSRFLLKPNSEQGVMRPSAKLVFNQMAEVAAEYEIVRTDGGGSVSIGYQDSRIEVDSISVTWTCDLFIGPDQYVNLEILTSDSLTLIDSTLLP